METPGTQHRSGTGVPPVVSPEAGRFCPACGYALRGLDAQGMCPECGTAYTPDTVWIQREVPPIGRMIGVIGIPLWGGLFIGLMALMPVPGLAGFLGIGAFLAAIVGLFSTPILMRSYAKRYLPPGERRWGMIRNAGRLSPGLLLVLILSYGVSILAGASVVAVGVVLAICAFNP